MELFVKFQKNLSIDKIDKTVTDIAVVLSKRQ